MKNLPIKSFLLFVEFTHRFQQVLRTNRAAGGERRENDAEHSFQVALVAWYLNAAMDLGFDAGDVLSFGVAHDLVEAYAGDTDPHLHQLTSPDTKEAREEGALERIRKDFPEFQGLAAIIKEYESSKQRSGPAQLVYAVDKLLVFANMYLNIDP